MKQSDQPTNKIEVEARVLKGALQGLSKVVLKRPALPVFGTIQIAPLGRRPGLVSLTAYRFGELVHCPCSGEDR